MSYPVTHAIDWPSENFSGHSLRRTTKGIRHHRSKTLGRVSSPPEPFPMGPWLTSSFDLMKPLLRVLGYLALCLLFTALLFLSALAGN
jgi:hypothetical protein